jgi:nucleoside-diphosphate-sugar epimerase
VIDSLAGKRIFVTGATGFIGGHLTRRLHAEGAHVLALERTPGRGDALAALGIEIVQGDITDHPRMREIVDRDVQVVMHIAAWLGRTRPVRDAETVNVTATRHLAEASAAAGVERFVFTSSIATYGAQGDTDVDEDTPLESFGDPYGDSKIRAEAALRQVGQQTGLPYVIVRPGMVYGPGSVGWTKRIAHPNAVGQIFNGVDDGPVTVADFLGGYMRMIPTRRAIRIPCWLARILGALADPFMSLKLTYAITQMCGQGLISNQKAKDLLGWQPGVSLEEGLRESERWLRAEGIL